MCALACLKAKTKEKLKKNIFPLKTVLPIFRKFKKIIFFNHLFIENNCITYLQFSCDYIETWRSSSRAREDDWAVPNFVLFEYNTHTRNRTKNNNQKKKKTLSEQDPDTDQTTTKRGKKKQT